MVLTMVDKERAPDWRSISGLKIFLICSVFFALFVIVMCFAFLQAVHASDLHFPSLSGRVVDEAQLLSSEQEAELGSILQQHEAKSTDQVVVVTVSSLQGVPIEQFALELGRHWGIGQKGKDNGVLLLVAPKERKVRIEVGYGLEAVLPDALAGVIVQRRILPLFKKGDLAEGIKVGVLDIQAALLGNGEEVALRARKPKKEVDPYLPLIFFAFWLLPFVYLLASLNRDRHVSGRVPGGVVIVPGSYGRVEDHWSGPGGFHPRSGGGFGGGFSGGGGSFGGGGASGSW